METPAISRRFALSVTSAFALSVSGLHSLRTFAAERQRLEVVLAVDSTGRPTRPWLDAIRDRVPADELAEITATARPLTPDEQGWADMIGRVAPVWFAGVERLNAPFRYVTPPARPQVILGHGGGDDAFGTPPDVMAFDLSALVTAYADRDEAARETLMPRLLSHEYTHLLAIPFLNHLGWTEAWAEARPYRWALRVLYNEGLGNMRSIEGDARWTTPSGQPTDRAREALARLTPILAERLQALAADPAPNVAKDLLRNISQGPFAGKWGALPIALWLAADTGFRPARIANWVETSRRVCWSWLQPMRTRLMPRCSRRCDTTHCDGRQTAPKQHLLSRGNRNGGQSCEVAHGDDCGCVRPCCHYADAFTRPRSGSCGGERR